MELPEIMAWFEELSSEANRRGMARYGINVERAFGVSMARIRPLAKRIGRDPLLSARLWDTGRHEPRILACLIGDPRALPRDRALAMALEFDSWDVCDQCCANLFDRTPYGVDLALELCELEPAFARRAGFALMAALAVHDTKLSDAAFGPFFAAIERASQDPRNFVKKAVNWALRQIGKRNIRLHARAVELAGRLAGGQGPARWIGKDALRELTSEATAARVAAKSRREEEKKTGRVKPGRSERT